MKIIDILFGSHRRSGQPTSVAAARREIRAFVQEQLAQGTARQAIADELNRRSDEIRPDTDEFVRQLRANMRGQGPMPKQHLVAQEYTREADRLFGEMVERNLKGRELEKAGGLDEAIQLYERNVADGMQASHPYDRLRIIYTRQKRYQDAIRICEAYLDLPDREHGQDKEHFGHHLERLTKKTARF